MSTQQPRPLLTPAASDLSLAFSRARSVRGPTTPEGPHSRSAVSRDNHEFNPAAQRWTLNKEVTLDLNCVLAPLDPSLRASYCRVLQFYAEHHSPAYCSGIHQGVKKFLKDSGADGFSASALRSYRAGLGRDNEWRLGTIRAFLIRWHGQGYPGISREAVDFLSSVTLKGNEKGGPVLSLDPDRGPFEDQELEAILEGVSQHYERGTIGLEIFALTMLLAYTGRRPSQLTLLRLGDLQQTTTPEGRRVDVVRIPRSKQRGVRPRAQFKDFWVDPDLYRVLSAQRDAVLERTRSHLGALSDPLIAELPLFPDWNHLEQIDSAKPLEEALRNDSLHTTTEAVRDGLNQLQVLSPRTGRQLHIAPRRFRYTLGTRAAREGYGAMVIAELLDHNDLQNVRVYTRDHPNFRNKIDAAVGQQLVPLAHAYAGELVDTEADARYGHDPSMRVGTRETKVGSCGSSGFCGAQAYACYTCVNFQPWLDAPHEQVLQWFLRDRQRAVDAGASVNVVAATDRSIGAVQSVIAACEVRRVELARAGS